MKIFLSYRRTDSQYISDRLFQALTAVFGADAVFKDIDSIALGADFRKVVDEAIKTCDALLVIIGDRWLEARDDAGKRRLDAEDDMVRTEIETALQGGLTVIPLLTEQARVPKPSDLPQSIVPLTYRNAAVLRPDPEFNGDIARLIQSLRRIENLRKGETVRPNEKRDPRYRGKLRYFCYVSRSKVDQLIEQLEEEELPVKPNAPGDRAFDYLNYLQGLAYGTRRRRHLKDTDGIMQRLKAVLSHIVTAENVADLNAICTAEAGAPLEAFCYSYSGSFTVVGQQKDPRGVLEIVESPDDPARSQMIDAGRSEQTNADVGASGMPIQSTMVELVSKCGSYTLNLACSLKYFSDMGMSGTHKPGAYWIGPHSGNYFFFDGRVPAWFDTLIFLNGVNGKNIYGTPLFLVTGADRTLRI